MESLAVICQSIIALGIYNVWILRFSKSTSWRGGMAKNMREEFAVYGLPEWFMKLIGFFKLLLATMLIAGIWLPVLTKPAALGMVILMLGAVLMHFKVKDPLKKSLPACSLLILSSIVAAVS